MNEDQAVDQAVDAEEAATATLTVARRAQREWERLDPSQRAHRLAPLAAAIADQAADIADAICAENGKPRVEAMAHEVVPAVQLAHHHCRTAPKLLADQQVALPVQPHRKARIVRRPQGVILAISPWNLPFVIPFSQVLSALLGGNAVILKPSELTPRTGELIGALIAESCDLPDGLLQVVRGDGQTAASLIEAGPDKVMFTGSVSTGRKVMAGCARFPIPVSLELGGVDAMVVRADADLEFASSAAVWGATFNGGQACCSIERLLIHESIFDQLLVRVADKLQRIDPRRELSPAIDDRQLDVWRQHLNDARTRGLRFLTGGQFLPNRRLEPTLLTGAKIRESQPWATESFGPVVAAVPFATDAEAIQIHNATAYGLTASIFTADRQAGESMAQQLRVGVAAINDIAATCYGSPELPWGGVGESGFGRTHGAEGLLDTTWPQVIESSRVPLNAKRPWWYPYGPDLEQALHKLAAALAVRQPVERAAKLARAGAGIVPVLSRNPKL